MLPQCLQRDARPAPWWREWPLWVVVLVVIGIYFSRLTTLPLRGEETRRAMVAREILWTGDWIVPRQQGEPFLSRPPLGSYPIALLALVLGDATPLATRLPTAIATLLTALLVYGYARQFLSATGAMGAGLGYASMGQVMQLGQIAETEAVFTLLVSGSLLLWHWGYSAGWSKMWTWSVAYLLVGLGALAKGPQAPVYFGGTVGVFLLYQRQWRELFSPAHFVGIAVGAAVLGGWQLAFIQQVGWESVDEVWVSDVGLRFVDQTWLTTIVHLLTFPGEVWIYLLPSSFLLLAYLHPALWREVKSKHAWLLFVVIAIAVTFPTCWIVPGAKPRYYMPMYPCLAVMLGLVVERLCAADCAAWLVALWRTGQHAIIVAMIGAMVALVGWFAIPGTPHRDWCPRAGFVLLFCTSVSALVYALQRVKASTSRAAISQAIIATAVLSGLAYTGAVTEVSYYRSEDARPVVAEIKEIIPDDKPLVSIGQLETMFTYHYGKPVPLIDREEVPHRIPQDLEYFCVNATQGRKIKLPFAWQQEAVVSCDRWKRDQPERMVVIGRRLPELTVVDHGRWRR